MKKAFFIILFGVVGCSNQGKDPIPPSTVLAQQQILHHKQNYQDRQLYFTQNAPSAIAKQRVEHSSLYDKQREKHLNYLERTNTQHLREQQRQQIVPKKEKTHLPVIFTP